MIVFLALITPIILIAVYYFVTRKNNYWKIRGIPYEEPQLVTGNLKDVISGKKHLGTLFSEIHNKFRDYPYCGMFELLQPSIMINDLELIKNVLSKDFYHFINNEFQIDSDIDPIWGANAFMQKDEKWKKTRTAWATSITPTKVKSLYDKFAKVSDVMIDHIHEEIKQNPDKSQDVHLLTSNYFGDSAMLSIFGLEINSFLNPDNVCVKVSRILFVSSFWDRLTGLVFLLAPKLCKLLKLKFVPTRTYKELLTLTKEVISNREKDGYKKSNILDSILLHSGKDSMSEIEIAGVLYSVFLNATETASGVAAFMLYSLATNLDVQEKLRKELDEAAEKNNGKLTPEDIQELPYLDMILCETLRMYPPLLMVQRLCNKPYELPPIKPGSKPFTIPKGMSVVIPFFGLHMNPDYHQDPEKFDPERFNPENKAKMPKHCYLPFGDGPRFCLGNRFAIAQDKIFTATVIRNFHVRAAPQMADKPIVIDPSLFLYRNIGGLWATFHERNLKQSN